MYITITGELGSGKSTVAKLISQKYDFMMYSTGVIQREIAKEKGMTTLELNQQMTNDIHNAYDKMIDDKTVELAQKNMGKNIVFDSRMAWHFVEQSFKVYVTVDSYVAAERVILADRGKEEHYESIEEAAKSLRKRKQLEDARFAEMYSAKTTDFHNYDLVVDSTALTPEELAEFIMENAKKEEKERQIFLSPLRLYPSQSVTVTEEEQEKADGRIAVVEQKGFYYIVNGHRQVCDALQKKKKLAAVSVLSVDTAGHVEMSDRTIDEIVNLSKQYYNEWEAYHGMKFLTYPD
ncbi:MAG: cytidylate kinase family protein [Lachnospiraceae bacterium]|nr:cytidylate kinase family protein [Lachnospiraceae bacterium]